MKTPISQLLADYCNSRTSKQRSIQIWQASIDPFNPITQLNLGEHVKFQVNIYKHYILLQAEGSKAPIKLMVPNWAEYEAISKSSGFAISIIDHGLMIKVDESEIL